MRGFAATALAVQHFAGGEPKVASGSAATFVYADSLALGVH